MTQKSKFTKDKADKSNYIRIENFFVAKKTQYYQPSQDKKINDKLGGSISNIQGNMSNFLTYKRFLTLKTVQQKYGQRTQTAMSQKNWKKDLKICKERKTHANDFWVERIYSFSLIIISMQIQIIKWSHLPLVEVERASQGLLVVKNLPANARRHKRCGFNLWIRKIPWRRAW